VLTVTDASQKPISDGLTIVILGLRSKQRKAAQTTAAGMSNFAADPRPGSSSK
jgi:hypothetical protein